MQQTLFEKYGGYETFQTIVRTFYKSIIASENLAPFFKDVNMEMLIKHQSDFISQVLGGPIVYEDDILKKVHAKLCISVNHFKEVAEILQEVLEDAGVEVNDVTAIMTIVASTKDDIVTC